MCSSSLSFLFQSFDTFSFESNKRIKNTRYLKIEKKSVALKIIIIIYLLS